LNHGLNCVLAFYAAFVGTNLVHYYAGILTQKILPWSLVAAGKEGVKIVCLVLCHLNVNTVCRSQAKICLVDCVKIVAAIRKKDAAGCVGFELKTQVLELISKNMFRANSAKGSVSIHVDILSYFVKAGKRSKSWKVFICFFWTEVFALYGFLFCQVLRPIFTGFPGLAFRPVLRTHMGLQAAPCPLQSRVACRSGFAKKGMA